MMQYITHYREKQYTWMNKLMAQTLRFNNYATKNAALFTECGINLIGISFFKVKRLYSG